VYSLEYTEIPKVLFTPHHVDRCCTISIPLHCCVLGHSCINAVPGRCCVFGSSCTNVIPGDCLAKISANNDLRSFLHCSDPSSHCCENRDRHERAHEVFFAHARAWRTPKKGMSFLILFHITQKNLFVVFGRCCERRGRQTWLGPKVVANICRQCSLAHVTSLYALISSDRNYCSFPQLQ
jgi:hypothetical protein